MIQYKKGRFHYSGVSFVIPENYYIEPVTETISENTIELHSPDGNFILSFSIEETEESTIDTLYMLFDGKWGFSPLQTIKPLQIHGLVGHCAIYRGGKDQYYEARFSLPENKHFIIIIRASHNLNIMSSVSIEEINIILNCIQSELL